MTRHSGFTLIELLITVVIVGILLSIAIPSYGAYIVKARRIEATTALTQIQMAQEKYRGNNLAYATLTQLGLNPTSAYYTFSVTAANDEYTLTAKAIGNQVSDVPCSTLSIQQLSTGVSQTPAPCWK
jgi:type IV pilus assembly protein PilE